MLSRCQPKNNGLIDFLYLELRIVRRLLPVILILGLTTTATFGQRDAVDQLVASKKQADITYRQLMAILGEASSIIHKGILQENKQMVREGADIVLHHPAPKHKPWTIMDENDQAAFKQSLLTFDKIMDEHAGRAAEAAAKENWMDANRALSDLNASCISCHAMWRNKTKR